MANPQTAESAAALRMLPSIDELLATPSARDLEPETGRRRLTMLARTAVDEIRGELVNEISTQNGRKEAYTKESLLAVAETRLAGVWEEYRKARLRKVINATGVVIHTNLGRAPLSDDAVQAIRNAAAYTTLEYDLDAGSRGKRGGYVERLLAELTGAESAIVVNNCAAAAFLVLKVFAEGGEVIVSRGELVEIGGDFRVPDVLAQSGATMKEVGTTNRTKLKDYEKAIGDRTKLLLRVHPSNYKIVGFTERPELRDLAALAHRNKLIVFEDAGSGALIDLADFGLADEPIIERTIADGADIVSFSGDKLLGGTQAGLIVGRRDLIEQLRKSPLYRALRVDKLIYAALEATLDSYQRERSVEEIPVLRMLSAKPEELESRATAFAQKLRESMTDAEGISIELIAGESIVGGGSAPTVTRPTTLIAIRSSARTVTDIERALRSADTPVIARIENDAVLLDLRTVFEDEEAMLIAALSTSLR